VVTLFVMLAMGWRGGLVVFLSVPVTFALTLLAYYFLGYTLNRITLFALVFITGIVVDDSIIIAENMHRHFKMKRLPPMQAAIYAINEVGNPTILATFTVIAAVLPMAFVSGLMGPYMSPMPIGASIAMMLSLIVALTLTPYLGYIFLREKEKKGGKHEESKPHRLEDSGIYKIYYAFIQPLLNHRWKRYTFIFSTVAILLISLALFFTKTVAVKMLPFDNKSELQVVIDMPEGCTLEETAALTREMSEYLKTVPEVTDYQAYVGTASPYNFNGLVRHYFTRRGSNVADIQVNFVGKDERSEQSHDIAKRLRPDLKRIGDRYGARIKLAEIPPGPPVLSTLVAEIYGPETKRQIDIAKSVRAIFEKTEGVVDVDWFVEDDQRKVVFEVDHEKAAAVGISTDAIAQSLGVALGGRAAGLVHMDTEKEPVEIFLRMPVEQRSNLTDLQTLTIPSASGHQVRLGELVKMHEAVEEKTIYHKNMKKVTYVTADVAGTEESPVYAILKMKSDIAGLPLAEGYELKQFYTSQPWLEDRYSMKWDGEWHITYEVFRDLGIAFAVVLIIIYILVVAWFKHFVTPLVIMAPIPLTLVGILPGHWVFGAFFTATSMIGFIALAGIVVRNSILLVDFIQMEWEQKGDLRQALIQAGAVRFRPIILTAAAVVVGSFVMLFDPIFQGLAIAMMFGAVASTLLTLIAVPLLYFEFFKNKTSPVSAGAEKEA